MWVGVDWDWLGLVGIGWGWLGLVGIGWGGSSLGQVNISNAKPKYLQPEILISGSCNYPPGYSSDPTNGP